ncbi:PX domain-containing protein [Termitomyces sp. J132]|nr:PX domain-containing protein [Termitomyces sp. J132]
MANPPNDPPLPSILLPPRPRRPTRRIPPLPPGPLATTNDESLVVVDSRTNGGETTTEYSTQQSPNPALPQYIDLTPIRAHYLKKSLVQLQFRREIDAITTYTSDNTSTLSFLGPPFAPPPKDAPFVDLPLLRYIFRQFVLTFPFMAAAPKDFYSEKLQPFVSSVLSRNISSTSVLDDSDNPDGNADQASRKKLLARVERNLAMFVGSAIRLAEQEQVVRLNQSDLDRLEILARKRMAKVIKQKIIFEVNVIGVKTVVDKGRMRSRAHEEFIIHTRRTGFPDMFVARRYGDFRTLVTELQKSLPNEQIRPPPPKDRTAVMSTPISPAFPNTYDPDPYSPLNIPQSPSQTGLSASRLAREKNRLTLRSYLHTLLATSKIASSPVMMSFLLSGPVKLTQAELEDAQRREEADRIREDGRKRFAKEIASRVDGLREAIKSVKGDVMGKDGLTHIFATVKVTPDVRDLPANYQAVLEWARISMASTVFHQFVASDNSSETFASLKRIHGLMPYFMLKGVLKISNPIAMIRGVLDLFLAQPFGGRSLLQRMFTSSLTEEVKALEGDIEAVKDKIDDPIMCAKIRQFVYAPREIQDSYKADAATERINLLTFILRAGDEPVLSRAQIHRLAKAHRAHEVYLKYRATLADSDDDDGPQNEDAWLMEDLKVLTYLYSRLRDREQLIALIFEGSTAELLKDIITIFYTPLAQVYRAASIADSLSDLQSFINDLIKTVEQVERTPIFSFLHHIDFDANILVKVAQEDPSRTVQAFISLIQRHEQSFYHFVHKVHSKGENLFDGLMHWVELFLTVVREGLGPPVSLEFLLPHAGKDRDDILNEVDEVARYHYKLKVAYEGKLRRRFGRIQERDADADVEDEVTQNLVNGVIGEIDFGELIHGDADDLAAEETDEESSDEYDDDDDDDPSEFESTDYSSSGESDSEGNTRNGRNLSSRQHVTAPHKTSQTTPSRPTLATPAEAIQEKLPTNSHLSRRSRELQSSLPSASKSTITDRSSKPLPPDPSLRSYEYPQIPTTPSRSSQFSQSSNGQRSTDQLHSGDSSSKLSHESTSRPSRKRKGMPTSKPPELQHIPKLLPVFVEMVTITFFFDVTKFSTPNL